MIVLECRGRGFIERGSVLLTDGHISPPSAAAASFTHKPFIVKGSVLPEHIPLPRGTACPRGTSAGCCARTVAACTLTICGGT